jgi:hypothetical protein
VKGTECRRILGRTERDILEPALLNSISSLPPVRLETSSLNAAMLSELVTSSANVSMSFCANSERELVDRAVAKTRMP